MGRMRTIKPEFGSSEAIAALSVPCRYHFAVLWTYADDAGRGVDNPRLLKAHIWPLDDDVPPSSAEAFQEELACHGRIVRYTNDGRALFEIVNFREHQKPNRPSPSKLPGPDDPGSFILPPPDHCTFTECSVRPHGALTPGGEGRVEERSSSSASGSRPDPATTFAAAVDIVVERRGKPAEAATKTRPNAWLTSARAGIAEELRAAGADRAAVEGADPDSIADLIELPPAQPIHPSAQRQTVTAWLATAGAAMDPDDADDLLAQLLADGRLTDDRPRTQLSVIDGTGT